MENFEVLQPEEMSPIEALERANIDIQIATAKKYPRSIAKVKNEIISIATLDEETAQACFYTLPARKGESANKRIQGASVRLAEIAVSAYGNIKAGARIMSDDGKFVTAQGVCHDVEKNVSISVECKRRVTTKYGDRYSDDMIQVTCQAACAIAYRNAVFKVVPLALVKPALDAAKKCAVGDLKSLSDRRGKMIEAFSKMGIEKERVFKSVNKESLEEINLADLEVLIGHHTAIKDGEMTVEELFPVVIEAKAANPLRRTAEIKTDCAEETPKPRGEKPQVHEEAPTQDDGQTQTCTAIEELNIKLADADLAETQMLSWAKKNGLTVGGKLDEFGAKKILNAWSTVKDFIAREEA